MIHTFVLIQDGPTITQTEELSFEVCPQIGDLIVVEQVKYRVYQRCITANDRNGFSGEISLTVRREKMQ